MESPKIITDLLNAAESGNEDGLEELLKAATPEVLNAKHENGNTALHFASKFGHKNVVDRLLVYRVSLELKAKNAYGNTALHLASKFGHTNVVDGLLVYRASLELEANNIYGETALHKAARWGHVGVVKQLLGSSTQQDHVDNATNNSANERAAIAPAEPTVNVNATDKKGRTPLHLAASWGHVGVVKQLLGSSTQQDHVDNATNNSANERAAIAPAEPTVNVNATDKKGRTPLHLAANWGHVGVVKQLLGSSTQQDHVDNATNNSANERAAIAPAEPTVNVNATDKKGRTPLHLAASKGHIQVVEDLLTVKHIGLTVEDKDRKTRNRRFEENAKDKKDKTPLHLAACKGHIQVVEQLLAANGIWAIAEDKYGKTPLERAFDKGKEDVQRRLSEELSVKDYIENLYRDRQVYVDAANAILVGAALIATVTFASWLQPPLGYTTYYGQQFSDPLPSPPTTYPQYASIPHHNLLQAFWVCNSLSFFCSIATVISGARSVLPSRRDFLKQEVRKLRQNLLVTSLLLVFSTAFVLAAFGLAGIAVVPPVQRYKINVYTTVYIGGICCFSCLFLFVNSIWDEWPKTAFCSKEGQQGYPHGRQVSTLGVWLWLWTCGRHKMPAEHHAKISDA